MDKLRRPASLHPVNPHQMLLTSELGLIVMDERFTNTPLVSVNHYMRSSPQFLRVSDYDFNSEFRTLALLGGYRYRDTRLIELSQGIQPVSKMLQELTSATCKTQPPASVGSPRKVCFLSTSKTVIYVNIFAAYMIKWTTHFVPHFLPMVDVSYTNRLMQRMPL